VAREQGNRKESHKTVTKGEDNVSLVRGSRRKNGGNTDGNAYLVFLLRKREAKRSEKRGGGVSLEYQIGIQQRPCDGYSEKSITRAPGKPAWRPVLILLVALLYREE